MHAFLSRTVRFSAWHHVAGQAVPHGHDYICTVTVSGPVDPGTGMVIDLAVLDAILRQEVFDRWNARLLERDTCEALSVTAWQRIAPRLPKQSALSAVRIAEDATIYAEYRGESA